MDISAKGGGDAKMFMQSHMMNDAEKVLLHKELWNSRGFTPLENSDRTQTSSLALVLY